MTQRQERSNGAHGLDEVVGEDTPTASSLLRLRERVFNATVGPGAVTKTAQEVQMKRTNLSRLIAPATIRSVAKVERHLQTRL